MRCASMIAARAVVLFPLTGVCGAGVLALVLAVGDTRITPARARALGERVATVDGARRVGVMPLCGATLACRVGTRPFSRSRAGENVVGG